MFLPMPFESVNSASALASGRYFVTSRIYQSPVSRASLMLVTYAAYEAGQYLVAADSVYTHDDGVVSACDYLLMPDHQWRDAAGQRHESLSAALGFATSFVLQREESYGFEHTR